MADTVGGIEYGDFYFQADGSVTATTAVSANFAATDTDAKLCAFNNTGNVRIRNRLGGTRKVKIKIEY